MSTHKPTGKKQGKLEARTVFASPEVRRVERLIDASGIVTVLDPMLPAGGRTRDLSLRTLLVGLGLAAAGNSSLYLKTVHAILLALGSAPGAVSASPGPTRTAVSRT